MRIAVSEEREGRTEEIFFCPLFLMQHGSMKEREEERDLGMIGSPP